MSFLYKIVRLVGEVISAVKYKIMDNLSLQGEPFGRLNLDELDEMGESYYNYFDAGDILAKIMELGITGSSILSCITLVYVIVRFDYLQTRTNMYILHYSICIAILFLLMPLYQLLVFLEVYSITHGPVICAFYRLDGMLMCLSMVFATALAIDWLIVSLNVSLIEKYGHYQKYIISLIYLVQLGLYINTVISCFGLRRIFSADVMSLTYQIMAVIVILINCLRFRKPTETSNKYKYALIISTYMMLSWLPALCLYLLVRLFFDYNSIEFEVLSILLETMFILIFFSTPLVSAFWLNTLNDDFSKAYKTVFVHKHHCNQQNFDDGDESRLIDSEIGQS